MTNIPDDDAKPDRLRDALAKMEDDLAWRGPGGRVMAYVVIPRALAEAVRDHLKTSIADSRPAPKA